MKDLKLRKILLMSRYGEKRFLKEIEPQIFKLIGDTDYMRVIIEKDGSIHAIDPTGGPMITVNSFIKKNIFVKGIDIDKNDGSYLIYTEN